MHHLSCMESQLMSTLKEKVKPALEHPVHRDVSIIHARLFISIYEMDDSMDELLFKLAKLNFNFSLSLYKKELSELCTYINYFSFYFKTQDLSLYTRNNIKQGCPWGTRPTTMGRQFLGVPIFFWSM